VISAAPKALELNPALVQALALLADAYQQEWRWSDAEAEDKQVLELNPNNAEAYFA
jgi:hypothetical protein